MFSDYLSIILEAAGHRIVNVSSIIGTTGFDGFSVYGANKIALIGFTRSLAYELGRLKITVITLSRFEKVPMMRQNSSRLARYGPVHGPAEQRLTESPPDVLI